MDLFFVVNRLAGLKRAGFFRPGCVACVAVLLSATGLCVRGQSASGDQAFEVAAVRPVLTDAAHPFNPRHFGPHVNSVGASYWGMTVRYLLTYAYGLETVQVTGPEWTGTERFDIEARFPGGKDKPDDRKMMQVLLRDRFKLTFHIEQRSLESYALVVAKHGAKLTPVDPAPALRGEPEADAEAKVVKNPDGSSTVSLGQRGTQTTRFDSETMTQHWELSRASMADLSQRLAICIDSSYHKVVDQTGLQGEYQVAFDCPVPGAAHRVSPGGAGVASDPQGDPLGRSLEALGLKLEKRKLPADVYVIDHVEQPSEN